MESGGRIHCSISYWGAKCLEFRVIVHGFNIDYHVWFAKTIVTFLVDGVRPISCCQDSANDSATGVYSAWCIPSYTIMIPWKCHPHRAALVPYNGIELLRPANILKPMVARGASVENSLTKLPDVFVAKKTSEIIEFTHAELCLPTKTSITNIYIYVYIYIYWKATQHVFLRLYRYSCLCC